MSGLSLQMAVDLKLTRPDPSISWGFRLAGGADLHVPLTVTQVAENSISQEVGLERGDVVVRINDTPTAGLTNNQTHDLLLATGNELILAIRRGDILASIPQFSHDEEDNEEVSEILRPSVEVEVESQKNYLTEKDIHFAPASKNDDVRDSAMIESPSSVISLEKQIAVTEEISSRTVSKESPSKTTAAQERKWSTFLQKPRNPPPKIKQTDSTPKGEPYRVVIVKQKKREKNDVVKIEAPASQKEEEKADNTETEEMARDSLDNPQTTSVDNDRERPAEEEINSDPEQNEDVSEAENRSVSEIQPGPPKVPQKEDKRSALQRSMEEKLAEIQKQLQALAQLPTTIQVTLNAVTKELENIVQAKDDLENDNYSEDSDQKSEANTYAERELSDIEENYGSERGENEESYHSNPAEDNAQNDEGSQQGDVDQEPDQENQPEDENIDESNGGRQQREEEHEPEPDPDEGLTEEEREARRIERERIHKHQKDQLLLKQRPTDVQQPLTPIQRPIILPGGRKWSLPDDAAVSVRRPKKMTDDKIADTIETFSEVIVGKTKGTSNCGKVPSRTAAAKKINFLKYTPPPKNLEYLHRSDVYKLVHDLEPPVRGIYNRSLKVLAEQDYYQQN